MSDTVTPIRRKKRDSPLSLRRRVEEGEQLPETTRAKIRVGVGTTQVLTGQDDLSTWDEEELRRGRRRGRNGKFQGKDPVVVPKAVHDELVRRTLSEAQTLMRDNLVRAIEVLVEIVDSPQYEAKDRLKAIDMIVERVMGKPKEVIEISGTQKWELALRGGIVPTMDGDADDEEDIIDV